MLLYLDDFDLGTGFPEKRLDIGLWYTRCEICTTTHSMLGWAWKEKLNMRQFNSEVNQNERPINMGHAGTNLAASAYALVGECPSYE